MQTGKYSLRLDILKIPRYKSLGSFLNIFFFFQQESERSLDTALSDVS